MMLCGIGRLSLQASCAATTEKIGPNCLRWQRYGSGLSHVIFQSRIAYRQSMWAERERPICRSALKPILRDPLSVPPRPPAPRAAHTQAFSGMSAHRSAPAHPIFCPLRSVFPLRSRSGDMLCLPVSASYCYLRSWTIVTIRRKLTSYYHHND